MSNFDLSKLNKEQLQAVLQTEGPVLVTAGAGTGKTNLLTHRVAYLIKEKHILPQNILAITFTNKATNEMKERISSMCENGNLVCVSTFHSFCAKVLRAYLYLLNPNFNRFFTILDDTDKKNLIKRILKDSNKTLQDDFDKMLSAQISNCKNENINPLQYKNLKSNSKSDYEDDIAYFYEVYEQELAKNNSVDFDDLIIKTIEIFTKFPNVLETYQNQYKYIHIDEFQDTNKTQFELSYLLSKKHKNILIVGDEDQSIYGWRGANYENLFNFTKLFADTKIFKLECNYRSTKEILNKANMLIANNSNRFEKILYTNNESGNEIIYKVLESDFKEADFVALETQKLIYKGFKPSDIAVLFRVNSISRPVETAFIKNSISYTMFGGFKFYDRAEIKNILAYLRLLVNPADSVAFEKIANFPKRGIGEAGLKSILSAARESSLPILEYILQLTTHKNKGVVALHDFFIDLLDAIKGKNLIDSAAILIKKLKLKETAYTAGDEEDENRLMNIRSLLVAINEFAENNEGATIADYLESTALVGEQEEENLENKVIMATVHAVKGLEFKVVFIISAEEDLFPFIKTVEEGNLEEERRLMYVAITRAKSILYITRANFRYSFKGGFTSTSRPSRFISEMGIEEPTSENIDFGSNYMSNYGYSNSNFGGYKNSYQKTASFSSKPYQKDSEISSEIKKTPDIAVFLNSLKKASDLKTDCDVSKYNVGTIIEHIRFGVGKIVGISSVNKNNVIIEFENGMKKELNLQFASLKIIG